MEGRNEIGFIEGVRHDTAGGSAVFVDYELYARYLEDTDLTEEQKREFLQLLWNIICEFVSLGWGVHPLQQALDAEEGCGKRGNPLPESATSGKNAVQWLDIEFIEDFTAATGLDEDRNGTGVEDG